jgi:hypothetical protein
MSIVRHFRLLYVSVVGAAIAALAACGSSGGGTLALSSRSPSASPTVSASVSAAATPSPSAGTGTTTGTGTGTGTTSGTGTGTGTGTGGGPTATLTITTKPSCPSGTNLQSFPGNGTTLSWTTTGTTGIQILLDGGLFSSYGPNGSATLPFACSGMANTTQTHTYTLVTMGSGSIQRSVTASALVNEITNVGPGGPVTPTPSM